MKNGKLGQVLITGRKSIIQLGRIVKLERRKWHCQKELVEPSLNISRSCKCVEWLRRYVHFNATGSESRSNFGKSNRK